MGAACCVAAKDRTIISGTPSEVSQRPTRYSPSWSFRWDNRGRVAGEETSANWLGDGGDENDRIEVKSSTAVVTAFVSEDISALDSVLPLQMSPVSEGNAGILSLQSSCKSLHDQANTENAIEMKDSTEAPSVSNSFPVMPSPTFPSVSSISTSPISSKIHLIPPNSTPSISHHRSPGHRLSCKVSDSRIPEYKSPTLSISEDSPSFLPSTWGNESTRGSNEGSLEYWSTPGLTELLTTRGERWSFDSEASGFSREKISARNSRSLSFDLQTCGVCIKSLNERSSLQWSSQKIISSNELAVVSVLTCGHVYHAECLESCTSEINKYDPACPVCTFGEKRIAKMSEKVFKAELDAMARKRSKKCSIDSDDFHSGIVLNRQKSSGVNLKVPKMGASSSMKSSLGKPFLKRHFSFGSKSSRSLSENQSTQKKGLFWVKSSKE